LKISKSGDTVGENSSLNVGAYLLRTLVYSDLSDNKRFAVVLATKTNQIQCQLNTAITIQSTDEFLTRQGGFDVVRFCTNGVDLSIILH
jgi:hypothetical protein